MNLVQRPLTGLRPHPLLQAVPSLADESPEFLRLIESIREHGIIDPLKITDRGLIVDGRHRARALRHLDRDAAPWCLVIPEARAAEMALESLCARRHLVTKGQLAYVAFPLFAPAYAALVERHSERLRDAFRDNGDASGVHHLASQIGVSRDEFFRAAKVHKLFAEEPELRKEWEPKILDPEHPVGLGAVISGIAGARATRGTARGATRNTALARWDVSWGELGKHSRAWERWSEEDREHAAERVRTTIATLPDPLLDVLRDALRAARRARSGGTDAETEVPAPRALSEEARGRIAAAAKERWGRYPVGTKAEAESPLTTDAEAMQP